jgi:hypothetical protein
MVAQGFRPVDADHCVRIDLEKYEPEEGQPELSELLGLERSGDFAMSTIHTYEQVGEEVPS